MVRSAFFSGLVFVGVLGSARAADLGGSLRVDGSSTVYPITAAVAEEFNKVAENKNIRVTVANSGTGGGFKKWCIGEADINDASRPITEKEEACGNEGRRPALEF